MFYEFQPEERKNSYKKSLRIIGELSRLFSDNSAPYLPYRIQENLFCKCFNASNLARQDLSADASFEGVGIGLKTWVTSNDQKVAEFGRERESYSHLENMDLVKKIAQLRNNRIRVTKSLIGLNSLVYHIVRRVPGKMLIEETAFDEIDEDAITLMADRGNVNNVYFSDGRHVYHFSTSKNTLYMIFNDTVCLDEIDDIEIREHPFAFLERAFAGTSRHYCENSLGQSETTTHTGEDSFDFYSASHPEGTSICLRLYSYSRTRGKHVEEHSGLNQWNGARRNTRTNVLTPRDPNELYIPYPKDDRDRTQGFFPPRDTPFRLELPNGQIIPAKICQDSGKAIMSNPNKLLGHWLLRTVFGVPEGTLITYPFLLELGIDSVVFTRISADKYQIFFTRSGTYEESIGEETRDAD